MYSFEEIKARSFSKNEFVLRYTDALELIYSLGEKHIKIYGWEGWILHPSGQLGHSAQHQGTVDLGSMPLSSALELTKNTIIQANREWSEKPEVGGATPSGPKSIMPL